MALRVGRRFFSVPAIKDFAAYEALKVSKTPVMVGWFTGHFSTAAKMFDNQFEAMAKAYPKYCFYRCDVDDCPTAAYDAEVEDVPSVTILPLGLKPDGSPYDKSDMIVIAPELARFDQVVPRAKAALDSLHVIESDEASESWQFDPATGTTLPPHK
eukprot:TRINITY_DN37981_c0_g1_i1.p1 TRINITY_DN37981_c0_g1~~TRINITY_DN37981_c0_g1_i1.p1  ORF type:complete len:156 (+),score=21.76 TRINITY_DN37981_c0_g1_i1:50-517(+)